MAGVTLLGRRFCQLAYITNDFDRALAEIGARGTMSSFIELRDTAIATGPGAEARCHVGLAMAGGLQIEIIEARGGQDELFREGLSGKQFRVRFHHAAQAVKSPESFEALQHAAEKQGFAIPGAGTSPGGIRYFYADLRALLGHYMEYAWCPPGALETLFHSMT